MNRPAAHCAAALVLSAAAFACVHHAWSAPPAASYQGDTVHSFVLFKAKHLGASWAYGRFNDFTVAVETNEAGTGIASVQFNVKAASVDTGNSGRDTHLKSPDFLNAKQFADIAFKSSGVKAVDADNADVTGDLTLHGVTKPLTVRVAKVGAGKGMKGEELMGWETTFTVKRSDFGMSNMVGPVSDEITLTVAVEGTRK